MRKDNDQAIPRYMMHNIKNTNTSMFSKNNKNHSKTRENILEVSLSAILQWSDILVLTLSLAIPIPALY